MSESSKVVPFGWSFWKGFSSDSIFEHIYLGNTEKVKEMLPNVVKYGEIKETHGRSCGKDSDGNCWKFTALGVSIAFGKKDIFEILMKQSGIDFTSNNSGGTVCVLFTNGIY